MAEHITAPFTPNQNARHALVHNNVSPPVANACDLQTPQGTHPEPSSSTTPPTPGAHSQPTPPLFSTPTLPTSPANYLSI